MPVPEEVLDDTATKLRAAFGAEYDPHFATNRPEDVEVHDDGSVFVALTNNTTAGSSTRTARSAACARRTTTRRRSSSGGATTRPAVRPGRRRHEGFSSPDNLVFDKAGNLWVVTDISSSRLNQANEYAYHKNNAMFMVPTSGPNKGIAFRFANGPVECEITGPYFTPDGRTCSSTSSTRAR